MWQNAPPRNEEQDPYNQLVECANALQDSFNQTGSLEDLDRIITLGRAVVDLLPAEDADRADWMNNLGRSLGTRFDHSGSVGDLDRAIELVDAAVKARTAEGSAAPPSYLANLANQLRRRFDSNGDMEDINRAIQLARMAVDGSGPSDPHRAGRLSNLASWLAVRYNTTGSRDDLAGSIDLVTAAIDATPRDSPRQIHWQQNLANRLVSRFDATDSVDDLDRAIAIVDKAIKVAPPDDANRYKMLNNLGNYLGKRYDRFGSVHDLDRAIDLLDLAKTSACDGHVHQTFLLVNLGKMLASRYQHARSKDDLDRAIEVISQAIDVVAFTSYSDGADCLTSLGVLLSLRFDQTGSIEDLSRAIRAMTRATKLTPPGHPKRLDRLHHLGLALCDRAIRTGDMDDLNQAIENMAIASEADVGDGYRVDRASYRSSLAASLQTRFQREGSLDDLTRAVAAAESAVAETPGDNPQRGGRLHNLSRLLGCQCELIDSTTDLNRAVEMAREAVNSIPSTHINWPIALDNLGNRLGRRYERTGSAEDLNEAIELVGKAIDATPGGHADLPGWQNDLATWLGRRSEITGLLGDLDRAIESLQDGINATPQDHPSRATWLSNLGDLLEKRGSRKMGSSASSDLAEALASHTAAWECISAPHSWRISAARKAARILADQSRWHEASDLLDEAVRLLPATSSRALGHIDKQRILAGFAGLASAAAAAALSAGKEASHALRILELGRGVIAGLLLEMRTSISDLRHRHPRLAGEFASLCDELDAPPATALVSDGDDNNSDRHSSGTPSWELRSKRRREAQQELERLLTRIRTEAGFETFLLPPPAEELMAAATPGPIVVVNLSPHRCDAFLVRSDRIQALELPRVTLEEVRRRAKDIRSSPSRLESMLEWLWDTICQPCLESLGFDQAPDCSNNGSPRTRWPRLWWIPTGALCQLPLHAAGHHRHVKAPGSADAVLDRAISSYAPSIKALMYGRREHGADDSLAGSKHVVNKTTGSRNCSDNSDGCDDDDDDDNVNNNDTALLVSMPRTPGMENEGPLPYAEAEVDMLERLCPSLGLEAVRPAAPRKDAILKFLQSCRLFHFAGHGRPHATEPSQSCLMLEDWKTAPLTVAQLRDTRRCQEEGDEGGGRTRSPPFLGYLSACWTGASEVDVLADEGIHLAGSFQLAGFRHVVGTLWEVSDQQCVTVARVLYETIRDLGMTDEAVCLGLHRALRSLRDVSIRDDDGARDGALLFGGPPSGLKSLHWVPYVHYGM